MGESGSIGPIIVELTEAERLANHIPEGVWQMSKDHNVFIKDTITGELIQVLDLSENEEPEDKVIMNVRTRPKRRKK